MLLMIRINLLGRSGGKKGKRGGFSLPRIPNVGLLLALLVLVIEGAAAFQWSQQANEAANRAEAKVRKAKDEVEELTRIKTELDGLKTKIEEAKKESVVFDELFAEKVGPANALTYLCFILAPRREAEMPGDDLKQMELAGWRVNWPGERARAWLTSVKEHNGDVTIMGQAIDHSDVAEVQRRLESSAYFRMTKLVSQEIKASQALGVNYVEFTIHGTLVYLIEPVKTEAPAEVPPDGAPPADADATGDGGAAADVDASGDGQGASGMLKSNLVSGPDADAGETSGVADTGAAPAQPDAGPAPILPRPAEAAPPPAAAPARGAPTPYIAPATEPPAADQGVDFNDPGPTNAPAPSAPAGAGSDNP